MRQPRIRSMSDHDLTRMVVAAIVEALLAAEVVSLDGRVSAAIGELERRSKRSERGWCVCEDCLVTEEADFDSPW